MPVWTSEHYDLFMIDGAGAEKEVKPGDFTFSCPDIAHQDRETHDVYDREEHVEAVQGRVKQYELTIEIFQNGPLSKTASGSVLDFIRGTGEYSGSSTVCPGGKVRAVHFELRGNRDAESETHRFNRCYPMATPSMSMEGNKISVKATCKAGITSTPAA